MSLVIGCTFKDHSIDQSVSPTSWMRVSKCTRKPERRSSCLFLSQLANLDPGTFIGPTGGLWIFQARSWPDSGRHFMRWRRSRRTGHWKRTCSIGVPYCDKEGKVFLLLAERQET